MPKAPTSAPQSVTDLVEHFQRNLEQYRSPQYKEAEVRREFIDPFLPANAQLSLDSERKANIILRRGLLLSASFETTLLAR